MKKLCKNKPTPALQRIVHEVSTNFNLNFQSLIVLKAALVSQSSTYDFERVSFDLSKSAAHYSTDRIILCQEALMQTHAMNN